MKSVIFWLGAIALGFYTYYDTTSLEQVRRILAVLVAVTLIYSSNIHDKIDRLEAANDTKDEQIAELQSDLEDFKSKIYSLEEAVESFDGDALVARIESLEEASS